MLLVKPIFILGKHPTFRKKKTLGFIKITKKREQKQKVSEILNKLKKSLKEVKILEATVIRNREQFEDLLGSTTK